MPCNNCKSPTNRHSTLGTIREIGDMTRTPHGQDRAESLGHKRDHHSLKSEASAVSIFGDYSWLTTRPRPNSVTRAYRPQSGVSVNSLMGAGTAHSYGIPRDNSEKLCGPDLTVEVTKKLSEDVLKQEFLGMSTLQFREVMKDKEGGRYAFKYRTSSDCPKNCAPSFWLCQKCVESSVPGNIAYGILGAYIGFGLNTLLLAAEFVNITEHFESDPPDDQLQVTLAFVGGLALRGRVSNAIRSAERSLREHPIGRPAGWSMIDVISATNQTKLSYISKAVEQTVCEVVDLLSAVASTFDIELFYPCEKCPS